MHPHAKYEQTDIVLGRVATISKFSFMEADKKSPASHRASNETSATVGRSQHPETPEAPL